MRPRSLLPDLLSADALRDAPSWPSQAPMTDKMAVGTHVAALDPNQLSADAAAQVAASLTDELAPTPLKPITSRCALGGPGTGGKAPRSSCIDSGTRTLKLRPVLEPSENHGPYRTYLDHESINTPSWIGSRTSPCGRRNSGPTQTMLNPCARTTPERLNAHPIGSAHTRLGPHWLQDGV